MAKCTGPSHRAWGSACLILFLPHIWPFLAFPPRSCFLFLILFPVEGLFPFLRWQTHLPPSPSQFGCLLHGASCSALCRFLVRSRWASFAAPMQRCHLPPENPSKQIRPALGGQRCKNRFLDVPICEALPNTSLLLARDGGPELARTDTEQKACCCASTLLPLTRPHSLPHCSLDTCSHQLLPSQGHLLQDLSSAPDLALWTYLNWGL